MTYSGNAYASGDALNGSMFFTGVTFADLGLAVGDSVFSLSNQDRFTVRVAAVPLPASLPLLAAGLGLIGLPALPLQSAREQHFPYPKPRASPPGAFALPVPAGNRPLNACCDG